MLEKFFKLSENHTDAKTEILAGITTFMTMAYILAVNPSIMAATGMDSGAVFTATALAAFIDALSARRFVCAAIFKIFSVSFAISFTDLDASTASATSF